MKKLFSVDTMMETLFIRIVEDFQTNLCSYSYCRDHVSDLVMHGIGGLRGKLLETTNEMDPYTFKCNYQINSLFKRYIFEKDRYTVADLIEISCEKFIQNQNRLHEVSFDFHSKSIRMVLKEARRYASKVLGAYDSREHLALCQFGSRATVGVPLSRASEAQRWVPPITGSKDEISWFCDNVIADCYPIQNYLVDSLESFGSLFQEVTHLTLSLVPKKFDSLRAITPNTTIGNFRSKGLGVMIERRLRRARYDIRRLQQRHGVLARRASVRGDLVTCDQSLASDNITCLLTGTILPPEWYEQLILGRIGLIQLPNGQIVETETIGMMGVGWTFPLQTLIFLSLLKAIDRVFYRGGSIISAYGDDLIYSKRLHRYVEEIFPQLGLIINREKTFSDGKFRESCGYDFFAGVDVRPFQPKTETAPHVPRITYEAVLYKTINGLLRRWAHEEIPRTLSFLIDEIEQMSPVYRVPFDYPDESGIKCSSLDFLKDFISKPSRIKTDRHGLQSFKCLGVEPNLKGEKRHEPYLWRALSGNHPTIDDYSNIARPKLGLTARKIDRVCNVRSSHSYFVSRIDKGLPSIRSRVTGRRFKRTTTYITAFSHRVRFARKRGKGFFTLLA